ncbi:GH25 family lysozyme [Brevibacillus porteri]|uniref:GH25 family lysozyme n=1 Tax=Brevibacillus porteri TaxID=2126350 RepID=UPI00370A26D1
MKSYGSTQTFGIDVSRWDYSDDPNELDWLDWNQLRTSNGVDFAIIKASSGGQRSNDGVWIKNVLTVDPKVVDNIKGAKGIGLSIGFYHYALIDDDNYRVR